MNNNLIRTALLSIPILALCACGSIEDIPEYPHHLVDIWYYLPEHVKIDKIEAECTIDRELPKDSNLYFSPLFTEIRGHHTYIGYSSDIPQAYDHNNNNKLIKLNSGFIFSRWDTINFNKAVRFSNSYLYFTTDNFGDYLSLRTPHDAKPGNYRFEISKPDYGQQDRNEGWYFGNIYDKNSKSIIPCGYMLYDGRENTIKTFASFIEIFAYPIMYIDKINISIKNIKINGMLINPDVIKCRYWKGVLNCAKVTYKDGVVIITISMNSKCVRHRENKVETIYDRLK